MTAGAGPDAPVRRAGVGPGAPVRDGGRPGRGAGPVAAFVAAVVAMLVLAGCGEHPAGAPAAPPAATATGATSTGTPAGTTIASSDPVRLDVPAIGVHADLVRLGLAADGTVEVPPLDSPDAGWYEHSPVPGRPGPAVLLGHVDSARSGPSVFYRLSDLAPGDPVTVTLRDGGLARFVVDRVERYHKAEFPTTAVYGDTADPQLRLITCGGVFDRTAHSYLDNVVVFASAAP